ncbi:MAG TPA: hypothetical protein VF815_21335 [Myxococcaceae bacterium]|jgi:hypothetical protein
MKHNPYTTNLPSWQSKAKKMGNPVSKMTQVAGKRIGGALRAENARQQKRKDGRH